MTRIVNDYLEELYQDYEPDFIREVRNSCPAKLQKMQLSISEAKLIMALLQPIKPKKILELGTLVGTSALWLASALVDKGLLTTVEKSYNNYIIAKNNLEQSPLANKIQIVHEEALEVLKSLENHEFDAIFIDAKKTEYQYYWPLAKKLVREGGLLLVDNSLMFDKGEEIAAAIQDFNKTVAQDSDMISVIIPSFAGLTYAIKK
jgi:predicted O-methyltransferase YrrM